MIDNGICTASSYPYSAGPEPCKNTTCTKIPFKIHSYIEVEKSVSAL